MRSRPSSAVALLLWALFCLLPWTAAARADDGELWPEMNLWYGVDHRTRLLLVLTGVRSRETGDRSEGEAGLYLDYRQTRTASWRLGYTRLVDPARDAGEPRVFEQRVTADFSYRWFVTARDTLSDRTRVEFRDLGDINANRYRNRLRWERAGRLGGRDVTPYLMFEAFHDPRYNTVASRTRWDLGVVFPLGRGVEMEAYVARQTDHRPQRPGVNALGLILTFSL